MQAIYLNDRRYAVDQLPSQPKVLVELLDLCHDDNATFEDFAESIGKDTALSARVIDVVNSPAYHQWNKETDLKRLLVVLGLSNVRKCVRACAVRQFFANITTTLADYTEPLWQRSLLCAHISHKIAVMVGYERPQEAFLCGLLHQIGMLLLLINDRSNYLPLLESSRQSFHTLYQREQQLFGHDHCRLGATLVDRWQLNSDVSDAIRSQHKSPGELSTAPLLTKILSLAAPLSQSENEHFGLPIRERAAALFNFTTDSLNNCINLARKQCYEMLTELGLTTELIQTGEQRHEIWQHLAEHIEAIALGNSVPDSETKSMQDFATQLRISLSMLFGIEHMQLFYCDMVNAQMKAVNDQQVEALEDISFSLHDHSRQIVRTWHGRTPGPLNAELGSVGERQIALLLKAQQLYLLPLATRGRTVAIAAIGTDEAGIQSLQQQQRLLQLFGRESALQLAQLRSTARRQKSINTEELHRLIHEASNPLTVINNYLYLLGEKLEQNHEAHEEIHFIREEIDRVGTILLQARDPYNINGSSEDQQAIRVNKIICDIDRILQNSLYKTARISSKLSLDAQIPELYCSKNKLKQVLLNLIKNAVEAVSEQAVISICSRDNIKVDSRSFVEITIRDNGSGIAEELQQQLFEAYQSSKKDHPGLGLTIVKTLLDEMGGRISYRSHHQEGSEFIILIPRNTEPQ